MIKLFLSVLNCFRLRETKSNPVAFAQNIRKMENRIHELESRLDLFRESVNDGLWEWDCVSGKVHWSDRVHEFIGEKPGFLGENFEKAESLMHTDDLAAFRKSLRRHFVDGDVFSVEVRCNLAGGKQCTFLIRGCSRRDKSGRPVFMAGSVADLTAFTETREKLVHNAFHDALTGLPNRALFMDRLRTVIRKTKRKKDLLFSVMLVDLKRFKSLNESLGHKLGDKLLREVSERLGECCRPTDTVARIGGDEFAILLEEIRFAGDAAIVAGRIEKELGRAFVMDGREVFAGACIGIVFGNSQYEDSEELLCDAATVLEHAKKSGKTSSVFHTRMRGDKSDKFLVESDLHKALDRGELHLLYQPIITLESGKVNSFEALVRWQHPERGEIAPSDFIPVAEKNGLILPMGEWIMDTAAYQSKEWVKEGFENISIAVNCSPQQFSSSNLPMVVDRALSSAHLDSKNLRLEVTESTAMNDVEKTIRMLTDLHERGLKISIDDFGTGYSSLSYLKRFPISTLKIDRSFIKDLMASSDDQAITSTIIALGQSLDLKLIAEGVENIAQLRFLKDRGCSHIQGYYFSQPLAAEKATVLLRKGGSLAPAAA